MHVIIQNGIGQFDAKFRKILCVCLRERGRERKKEREREGDR